MAADPLLLLEERARHLARPLKQQPAGAALEVIAFTLAGELYAIEARYVVAVSPLLHLSALPGAEPPLHGVTGWRGELLTVLDLRRVLGLSVAALDDLNQVLVLGEARAAFGLLVNAVQVLASVPLSSIHPLPEGRTMARPYLRGMTSEAMLLLDAKALLREWADVV
jgi:purine-binding chemotaxis protein CheW